MQMGFGILFENDFQLVQIKLWGNFSKRMQIHITLIYVADVEKLKTPVCYVSFECW